MTTQVDFHQGKLRETGDDVALYVYTSDIDGTTVVEIETYGVTDVPEVRIILNDGTIWDRGPTRLEPQS